MTEFVLPFTDGPLIGPPRREVGGWVCMLDSLV